MTDTPEKPAQSAEEALQADMAKRRAEKADEAAIWQPVVRGYLTRIFADLSQIMQRPRDVELVTYALEVLAEQSRDFDLLTLVGPFVRDLPDAHRKRHKDQQLVQEFREKRARIRSGRAPLRELAQDMSANSQPAAQAGQDQTRDDMTEPTKSGEDAAARRQAMLRAFAQNKAMWQADLRLRYRACALDYMDSNHPPESVEIAQFLLELVAERCDGDYHLLGLILPFAERLPYELEARRQAYGIASEFLRVGYEREKYGPNGRPTTGSDDR